MSDSIQNIRIKYVVDPSELTRVPEILNDTKKKFDDVNKSVISQTKSLDALNKEYQDLVKLRNESTNVDEIKKYNKQLEDQKKNIDDLGKTTKTAKEEFKEYGKQVNIFGVNVGQVMTTLNGGIGTAVRGLGVFKLALIGTGLGAFLVAIGAVVTYFKSTEKGAEQLERAMAGIGATVKVLIGRFASLGAGLVAVFSGDFSEAAKIFKSAFSGIGDEISKASKEAIEFTNTLQEVEDAENNLKLAVAKSINERQKLAILAKKAGEDSKEGIALIRQAVEIEKDIVDQQIKLQTRKVAALKTLNDQARASGEIDKENELESYRDAQIQLENLRGNSLEIIAKLDNKAASLSLKDQKAANKARLDEEKKHLKDVQDLNNETLGNAINIEAKKDDDLNKSFDRRKENQKSFHESVKALQKQSEIDYKASEKAKTAALKEEEDKKKVIISSSLQAINVLTTSYSEISKNENEQRVNDLSVARAKELKQVGDNKAAQAIINKKFDTEERKIKREQAIADRNLAIFNIVLSTAVAIANVSPNPVLIALAGLTGVAQLAVAQSRPIPKFNKGTKSVPGVDMGGDSVLAMVRPTEKIFPVSTSKKYEPALDAIFDNKVPASLINSFALNYDKLGRMTTNNIAVVNNSGIERKLDSIEKTLSNLPISNITLDKKGVKSFVRRNRSETEFVNNYFKS